MAEAFAAMLAEYELICTYSLGKIGNQGLNSFIHPLQRKTIHDMTLV